MLKNLSRAVKKSRKVVSALITIIRFLSNFDSEIYSSVQFSLLFGSSVKTRMQYNTTMK